MKRTIGAGLLSLFMSGAAVFAAERTVTLDIEGMSCPSCPYQVESALKGVDGVISAKASLAKNSAVVKFDDAKTDVAGLTKATEDVGFPSSLAKQGS